MEKKSDEFIDLLYSTEKLRSALENNPALIRLQDVDGNTLLHHVARFGLTHGSRRLDEIFCVLLEAPSLSFTIKNNQGDTPLHIAAEFCYDRQTSTYVFPMLVKEADTRKFDFSILNKAGLSVLHIATLTPYIDTCGGGHKHISNVKTILDNTKNPGLNVLSSSGATALFYSLKHAHFDEAKELLDAGANPLIFGTKQYDPMTLIENYLKDTNELLSQDEYQHQIEQLEHLVKNFNELKQIILSTHNVKSYAEIRKSARVLAQDKTISIFASLPKELLIKIAAFTKNPGTHIQEEAEKIATEHLTKPKI